MPQYVVLYHELSEDEQLSRTSRSHFDWMFEHENGLATWATETLPSKDQSLELIAIRLPDHRKAYLTYEGAVSGNRGHVTRREAGTYEVIEASEDSFQVLLSGDRTARIMFQRIVSAGNLAAEVDRWYASFRPTRVEAS